MRLPCVGRGACMMHGGKVPRGRALPQFKHGRFSKDLPERLARRVEQAQQDPELLSIAADVAMLEARAAELCRRFDSGESGAAWRELQDQWSELEAAMKSGDAAATKAALEAIGKTVRRGAANEENWAELQDVLARKASLAARENKRLVDMRAMLTIAQVGAMMASIAHAIREHVTDPAMRANFLREFCRLTGRAEPPSLANQLSSVDVQSNSVAPVQEPCQ